MNAFRNLKLTAKLALAFGALLTIMAGGLVAFVSGRAITRPLSGIIDIFKGIAAVNSDVVAIGDGNRQLIAHTRC
jgi:hypothetical protein